MTLYEYEGIRLIATGEVRPPKQGEYFLYSFSSEVAGQAKKDFEHCHERILIPFKTYYFEGIPLQVSGEYRIPNTGEYFLEDGKPVYMVQQQPWSTDEYIILQPPVEVVSKKVAESPMDTILRKLDIEIYRAKQEEELGDMPSSYFFFKEGLKLAKAIVKENLDA
jgi:hypothetical protein